MQRILKGELNNAAKFKGKLSEYIQSLRRMIQENYGIDFDDEEIGDLLLSACRSDDFGVICQRENKLFLMKIKF